METGGLGLLASLHPQNERLGVEVRGEDGPRRDLLFDPQTSGGLLAGVAPHRATACVAAMHAAGDRAAAVVGRVAARRGTAPEVRLQGPASTAALSLDQPTAWELRTTTS